MQFPRKSMWAAGTCLLAGTLALLVSSASDAQETEKSGSNALGLAYTPLPEWFKFQPKATVNTWVAENDVRSMTTHAWELWGALTELTTQSVGGTTTTVPIFETWLDPSDVFSPPPAPAALLARPRGHRFERPRQFEHLVKAAMPMAGTESQIVVEVKYTKEMQQHVRANEYYSGKVLQRLNDHWGSTPLAGREVASFPDTSVMLKPVYQIVSGTKTTLLPYWSGAQNSTTPGTPGPGSWTSRMAVIPPGGAAMEGVPNVKIERFYHVRIEHQVELETLKQAGLEAKLGDYAILVAMHVSSREIDEWTWQTLWWSYEKPSIPGGVRERVQAPFDNYEVAIGYSFMTAPGNPGSLPLVCMNPYLEAGFGNDVFAPFKDQLGIESSCMSCHRAAKWPPRANETFYVANGLIEKGDTAVFKGTTKTDFVWGFAQVDVPTGD